MSRYTIVLFVLVAYKTAAEDVSPTAESKVLEETGNPIREMHQTIHETVTELPSELVPIITDFVWAIPNNKSKCVLKCDYRITTLLYL